MNSIKSKCLIVTWFLGSVQSESNEAGGTQRGVYIRSGQDCYWTADSVRAPRMWQEAKNEIPPPLTVCDNRDGGNCILSLSAKSLSVPIRK